MKNKIFDCITFFDNNFMFDLRYNILKEYVDYFIVCECLYDHRGNKKNIIFNKENKYNNNKIKHIVMENNFPKDTSLWENQAIQREFLLDSLDFANPNDYIFFSDPDEIPKPDLLINFELKKKYGIFLQDCFNYKFNLFNPFESPWEGTRVAKKKDLKSIDFMRQKVKIKNLNYSFLRIDKEKSVQIFEKSGWHFNNIMSAEKISLKLKTFAHSEFSSSKFTNIEIIKKKIKEKVDLFERGHKYIEVELDNTFPKFIVSNKEIFKNWIL